MSDDKNPVNSRFGAIYSRFIAEEFPVYVPLKLADTHYEALNKM
jgi:hypothetical protein